MGGVRTGFLSKRTQYVSCLQGLTKFEGPRIAIGAFQTREVPEDGHRFVGSDGFLCEPARDPALSRAKRYGGLP